MKRAIGSMLTALAILGCRDTTVPLAEPHEPFFYLVLGQHSTSVYDPEIPGKLLQRALLLDVGSPIDPPTYRMAERFEMWRVSDGKPFDWREEAELNETAGLPETISLEAANYYLPELETASGLGSNELEAGGSYEIEIETEGYTIRGRTTVPVRLSNIRLVEGTADEPSYLSWTRPPHAEGFMLSISPGVTSLQRDTIHVLTPEQRDGFILLVRTMEENLYRYMSREDARREGITEGFGVFGALAHSRFTYSPSEP